MYSKILQIMLQIMCRKVVQFWAPGSSELPEAVSAAATFNSSGIAQRNLALKSLQDPEMTASHRIESSCNNGNNGDGGQQGSFWRLSSTPNTMRYGSVKLIPTFLIFSSCFWGISFLPCETFQATFNSRWPPTAPGWPKHLKRDKWYVKKVHLASIDS